MQWLDQFLTQLRGSSLPSFKLGGNSHQKQGTIATDEPREREPIPMPHGLAARFERIQALSSRMASNMDRTQDHELIVQAKVDNLRQARADELLMEATPVCM